LRRSKPVLCGAAGFGVLADMDASTANSLLPTIQAAVTPVILISGMGLLLLTMTNRMGRIMDRTRAYAAQIHKADQNERQHLDAMLESTWRRAKLVRLALTFATSSMLLSAALVIVIFLGVVLQRDLGGLMLALFVAAILLLIAALAAFLRDVFVSLSALHLEVKQARARGIIL
jgi:hypothetical protein